MDMGVVEQRCGRLANWKCGTPSLARVYQLMRTAVQLCRNDEAVPMDGRALAQIIGNCDLHVITPVQAERWAEIASVIAEGLAFAVWKECRTPGLGGQRDRLSRLAGVQTLGNSQRLSCGWRCIQR